jgi:hypothetical protein
MQKSLTMNEECFHAVFVETDVPADVHNRTAEIMIDRFGSRSDFQKEGKGYVMPYLVNIETGLASIGPDGLIDRMDEGESDTEVLRGSGFRVGGMFFPMDIADTILEEFRRMDYEIEKKYD